MCFNCALACHCPYGDARRIFGQGTPKEVWDLMEQTWTAISVPLIFTPKTATNPNGLFGGFPGAFTRSNSEIIWMPVNQA